MKNELSDNLGMTLIEILVGISIMTITTGLMLVNYRGYNNKNNLVMGAYRLASDLRLAQNYALGLKEHDGVQPDGWGLYFDRSNAITEKRYIIFADRNDNGETPDTFVYDSTDEDYLTVQLPPGVIIKEFQNNSGTVYGGNQAQFIVIPPDPDIGIIDPNNAPADEITIVLGYTGGSGTREIKINKFGLIDID